MAPEIFCHDGYGYQGKPADIFATGVILFMMLNDCIPFAIADPSQCAFYRAIYQDRSEHFWSEHFRRKRRSDDFLSEEVKDLIISMLQPEPEMRPTIADILSHPWMQKSVPTKEEVQEEFRERMAVVYASKQRSKRNNLIKEEFFYELKAAWWSQSNNHDSHQQKGDEAVTSAKISTKL